LSNNLSAFHFPFVIFDLSFVIDCIVPAAMTNENWKMANGKWEINQSAYPVELLPNC
jgi:hypothetical protein